MRRFVKEGERFPRGYRLAYYDPCCDVAICYPLPFNWIVGWTRQIYYALQKGPRDRLDAAFAKKASAMWNSGYEIGHRNGLEDGYRRRKEHMQAIAQLEWEHFYNPMINAVREEISKRSRSSNE